MKLEKGKIQPVSGTQLHNLLLVTGSVLSELVQRVYFHCFNDLLMGESLDFSDVALDHKCYSGLSICGQVTRDYLTQVSCILQLTLLYNAILCI